MFRLLSALLNAWRIPELRRKLIFTLSMIAIYEVGLFIPVPGVNGAELGRIFNELAQQSAGGLPETAPVFALLDDPLGGHQLLHVRDRARTGDPGAVQDPDRALARAGLPAADRPDHDWRDGAHHVAGRADHRAGHPQRDEPAHHVFYRRPDPPGDPGHRRPAWAWRAQSVADGAAGLSVHGGVSGGGGRDRDRGRAGAAG